MSTAEETSVNVSRVIDTSTIKPFHALVIGLCALIAILDGFDTQAIAFVAPSIAEEWKIGMSSFGPVFSAGLVGLTFGAVLFSPLADKFGRRSIILASVLIFGSFGFLTAFASSITELLVLRFLTGIGLGAAMPNLIALTAEYSPAKTRNLCVTLMFCGFPLGAVIGGVISNYLIAAYDWHHVFYVGGALPVLLLPILWRLPESPRFLVTKGGAGDKLAKILARLDDQSQYSPASRYFLSEERQVAGSVASLFAGGRAPGTLMLWVAFFCNLLVMYFLINWLPSVLRQAGHPLNRAIMATVLFNMGGVLGGVAIGYLIDRWGAYKVLITAYLAGSLATIILGAVALDINMLMAIVFCAGVGLMGGQLGLNALAAGFYPTHSRSTGVGWALGFGRVGSIIGPLVGGYLLSLNWDMQQLYLTAAVPALVAALMIFGISRATKTSDVSPNKIEPTPIK
ncbi:MAG: MFS transporter [Brucella sp.]